MIMQVEPAYENSLPFPPSPLPIVDTSSTQKLQAIRARENEEEEDLEDAQQILLPRAYQDEVYKLAKERNTIVRLDTGAGKTYISIMLIRYITSMPQPASEPHKIVVFLCPSVPLVHQQARTISCQTDLNVKTFIGGVSKTKGMAWNKELWEQELDSSDIVVMTPMIFLNLLRHAYWSLYRTSLIVFDEAHHCNKGHPYNSIMQEFYHRHEEIPAKEGGMRGRLPRILGLTASPICNPVDAEKSLRLLESNLASRTVEVKINLAEVYKHAPRPKERVLSFLRAGPEVGLLNTYLEDLLCNTVLEGEEEVRQRARSIKEEMGELACDIYLTEWLGGLLEKIQAPSVDEGEEEFEVDTTSGPNFTSFSSSTPSSRPERFTDEAASFLPSLEKTKTMIRDTGAAIRSPDNGQIPDLEPSMILRLRTLHNQCLSFLSSQTFSASSSSSSSSITPKVESLISELVTWKNRQRFHGIVFVHKRYHARILCRILGTCEELRDWIRVDWVAGHGTGVKGEGMTMKLQTQKTEAFRKNDTNLLVATSVAEEGLDFVQCNVVIRYDGLNSLLGYIQSRGRARFVDSEYIVMIEEGTEDATTYFEYLRQEPLLRKLYQERPEGEMIVTEGYGDGDERMVAERLLRYTVEETGASLTPAAALKVVSELCSLLPADPYMPKPAAHYEFLEHAVITEDEAAIRYQGKLTLPAMACLPPDRRTFTGGLADSRQVARRLVAFEACKVLHSRGALNDLLVPFRVSKGKEARNADGEAIDPSPVAEATDCQIHNHFGYMWREENSESEPESESKAEPEIWLHLLTVVWNDGNKANQTVGLVSGKELRMDRKMELIPTNDAGPILTLKSAKKNPWSGEELKDRLEAMDTFTRFALQAAINRRPFDAKLMMFILPLVDGTDEIDWDLVKNPTAAVDAFEGLGDHILVAPHRRLRRRLYRFDRRREDLQMSSPPARVLSPKGNLQLLPFVYRRSASYDFFCKVVLMLEDGFPPDEPLVQLVPILNPKFKGTERRCEDDDEILRERHTNAVGNDDAEDYEALSDEPQYHILPQGTLRISRLQETFWDVFFAWPLIHRTIHDTLGCMHASKTLALPNLDPRLLLEALTLPGCMSLVTYETLETYGDAFLKLATSVHVYYRHPLKDEGQLTQMRQHSVDNLFLRKQALKIGLGSLVFSEPYRNISWIPPTSERGILAGDGLTITRTIPRRALSDVVEGLLGASYLSGGLETALKTGTLFGLCFGGDVVWHDRYPEASEGSPLPSDLDIGDLQTFLDYQFQDPLLLVQALTHRSYATPSTQTNERIEFLGDAIFDFFVVQYLYARFAGMTPKKLSRTKSALTSNSTMCWLAVRRLSLHKSILHSSPALRSVLDSAVLEAMETSPEDFFVHAHLREPPKALSDALEAIVGAIFIDCGHKLEVVFKALENIYLELLPLLKAEPPLDPVSDLLTWARKEGCGKVLLNKLPSSTTARPLKRMKVDAEAAVSLERLHTYITLVHDQEISRAAHRSQAVAHQIAAMDALKVLRPKIASSTPPLGSDNGTDSGPDEEETHTSYAGSGVPGCNCKTDLEMSVSSELRLLKKFDEKKKRKWAERIAQKVADEESEDEVGDWVDFTDEFVPW